MYVSYFQLKETEVVSMAPKSSDGKAESMPFNFTVTERGLNSDVPRPHGYTWTRKKPDESSGQLTNHTQLNNSNQNIVPSPCADSKAWNSEFPSATEDALQAKFAPRVRRYSVTSNNVSTTSTSIHMLKTRVELYSLNTFIQGSGSLYLYLSFVSYCGHFDINITSYHEY